MQIITKGGKLFCTTMRHYPPEIVAQIKKAGYRVKEKDVGENGRDLRGVREAYDDLGRKGKKGAGRSAHAV